MFKISSSGFKYRNEVAKMKTINKTLTIFASLALLLVLTLSFASARYNPDIDGLWGSHDDFSSHLSNINDHSGSSSYSKTIYEKSTTYEYKEEVKSTNNDDNSNNEKSRPVTVVNNYYSPPKKTVSEPVQQISYQPFYIHNYPTVNYQQYYNPRTSCQTYYYGDQCGQGQASDFGNKPAYNYFQYGPDNYGQPYYYQPRYNPDAQSYNWGF